MRDIPIILAQVTRTQVLIFCSLSIFYALAEGFSISLLLPIFQSIQVGESILAGDGLPEHLRALRWLIDAIGVPANLISMLVLALGGILIRQVFQFVRVTYGGRVQEGVTANIRSKGFEALVRSDIGFFNTRRRGQLHSALTADAPRGSTVVFQFLRILGATFLLLGYIILLFLLSPLLTLIAVAASLVTFWAVRFIAKASMIQGQQISALNATLNSALIEKLSGIREVKLTNREEQESQEVRGISRRLAHHLVRLRMLGAGLEATVEPIMVASAFLMLFLAQGIFDMPLANLVMFMFVLFRVIPLTREINNARQSLSGAMAALENALGTISEAEASRHIIGGSRKFEKLQSGIEFNQVTFTYSDNGADQWALQDICTFIPSGTLTALVGKSGAGKSTFANLIPRLNDVSKGQIKVDGFPVQSYTLESLRPRIGFVSQEVFLFNDSIYNNLTYGLLNVPNDKVIEATERAGALEFVEELPEGFDTLLGDRGVRLSAGQRQRLSIAKAMLREPEIFILDEPTSALDSETELRIQNSLEEMRQNKTVLVIAHRLSTIQRADQILVLDGGRLVQSGVHAQLVREDGTYKRLFDLQMIGG